MNMDTGGFNWSIMNVVGPILLLVALLWLVLRRNKGRNADFTERKTHDLYEEEERRRREGTDEL
jgi:hypothetical protein